MAINLVCVPVVYIFYPETKGRSLEDMDVLFRRGSRHGIRAGGLYLGSPTGSQTNLLGPESEEEEAESDGGRERSD